MSHDKSVFLALALVAGAVNSPVMAAPLPCEVKLAQAAIPKSVFFLPESQAAQLQTTLISKGSVRLKPGGNYRKSLTLKLTSNQALYGLAGTKLPAVIIPEGTSNAILSGVNPGTITFEGTGITKGNCLNRIINSKIEAKNTTLINNVFTDLSNTKITIDNTSLGYLRDNRFIRTMTNSAYPAITITGDSAKQSSGNLFVWTNILIPGGDSIVIKNQKDIAFIGIEGESWNTAKKATYPGMLNVLNTDFLSVFMASGADYANKVGQYFNLDVTNILLQGMVISPSKKAGIILSENVENLFTLNASNIGLVKNNPATQVIDYFYNRKPEFFQNQVAIQPDAISMQSNQALLDTLHTEQNIYSTWDKPQLVNIASPAKANWESNRIKQTDSSDKIQALIDQNGIAELNAGIYYIAKPLIFKEGQGIIGAGMDKTALIAMYSDMDMIIGGNHITGAQGKSTGFILADITLQGGNNGINHDSDGSGDRAQYNLITLSHVVFRNMKNSGIFINNIYGWDNNYIDYVQFIDNNTAIMQRPDVNYTGGDRPGMNYIDKNVFYSCRFENNNLAIDWPAKRANNLNAFINSVFIKNNKVIKQSNNNTSFFANSIFKENSGSPSIESSNMIGVIHSDFSTSKINSTIFGNNTFCNDCLLHDITNGSQITTANSLANFFISSQFDKNQQLKVKSGLIVNTDSLP